jgi:hypothetical protein
MIKATLLGAASVTLLAASGLAQTQAIDFVNKVAQSDMLEIQTSQFVAPNADSEIPTQSRLRNA